MFSRHVDTSCLQSSILHCIIEFIFLLGQARHILSSVQELVAAQGSTMTEDEEVSYLALENQSLHLRLAEQQQQYTTTMTEVTAELSSTQREMVSKPDNVSISSWSPRKNSGRAPRVLESGKGRPVTSQTHTAPDYSQATAQASLFPSRALKVCPPRTLPPQERCLTVHSRPQVW